MPSQSHKKVRRATVRHKRGRSAPMPTRETRSKRKTGARMTNKNLKELQAYFPIPNSAVKFNNGSKNSKEIKGIEENLNNRPEERNRGKSKSKSKK